MKEIETFVLGAVQVNTYILWNDHHALIIDPGSRSMRLQEAIDERNGIVDGIVLTHAHFDHIAGVDTLVDRYHCHLYMNDLDMELLQDPRLNFSIGQEVIVRSKALTLLPGEHTIGAFTFTFIDVPGHSEGSSMVLWDQHLFSGDMLFQGSIGRTDLATSSNSKMAQSLRKVVAMDPGLIVYPGHGPKTTLKEELLYNPFLQF